MNLFIPIFLILISIVIFIMYIDPVYKGTADKEGIKQLLVLQNNFEKKKANIDNINKMKMDLRAQYNLIAVNDLKRIKKLLPNHMDNIKLIVDIQRIGYSYRNNIRIGNISLSKNDDTQGNNQGSIKIIEQKGYDSVVLNFSFISNYRSLKNFLEDLHKSLRLVDIVHLDIKQNIDSVSSAKPSRIDSYKVTISIRTYWMNDDNLI